MRWKSTGLLHRNGYIRNHLKVVLYPLDHANLSKGFYVSVILLVFFLLVCLSILTKWFFFQSVNCSSFMCVKIMKLLISESFLMIPMWDFIVRFRVLTRAKLIKLERLITYQVPTSDSKYKFKKKRQFEMNHWLS